MTVPNIFANQSGPIPLSQLDDNFSSFQDTSNVANGDALLGVKAIQTGAVGRTQHGKNGDFPMTPQDFGVVGDGITNDTVNWTAWSNAVQASNDRVGYMPSGVYLIDSWSITAYGSRFIGALPSSITLTHGVKIKARTAVNNFVLIAGAIQGGLENVEIDGNNLATNTVRMSNNLTDFAARGWMIGGCVDGGVNLNMEPISANTQVSELPLFDIRLAGCGSRASGLNITNLRIKSTQSLVIAFYNLKSFGNTAGATDVPTGIDIIQGTCTFYTLFSTKIKTQDFNLSAGSVTIIDGRSESDTADSINASAGTGDLTLINYVHGTTTTTSLNVASGFTGRVNVVGGQYNNITNSSATADVVLVNPKIFGTGSIGGTYANRIIRMMGSIVKSARKTSITTTLAYGVTVTIDASSSDRQYLLVADGVAFTMAAPTNPTAEQTLFIDIQNGNGAAMGLITWNAVFKMAGAFTNPATGKRRRIQFTYDGANWIEDGRTAADGSV